jgi:sugar (pentulose or hexulose) kinase
VTIPVFLAIDAGTTSLKAAIFDAQGRMLALDRREYRLLTPAPNVVELDPDVYWQAMTGAVRSVFAQSRVAAQDIASLCISSQGETFIPVDARGVPQSRAIVWLDNRAGEEANLITRRFGPDEIFHHTGQPEVAPTWPACKMLWLRKHTPEVFNRTHKFLWLEDYLLHRLTGQFVTSAAQQTSSLLLDIQAQDWWPDMMVFVGITPGRLGKLMKPGEPVGVLRKQAAEELGLTGRTVAVTGSMDQAIAALGAGNIAPGLVVESTGGALGIVATLNAPLFDPQRRIPCYLHAIPDTYCLLPWGQTAGMALKWFRDQFFVLEAESARQADRDPYDAMTAEAALVPAGSEGLVMLPHLEGAFCPEFNPNARGVFFGATLRHGRPHFIRAILESVAFMLKRNLDLVEGLGIPVETITSLGGGARSHLWLQIKADVLQKPVHTLLVDEAACLGAAILGAVAAGVYPTIASAVKQMVQHKEVLQPNPVHCQVYQQRYKDYVALYDSLTPMFKDV